MRLIKLEVVVCSTGGTMLLFHRCDSSILWDILHLHLLFFPDNFISIFYKKILHVRIRDLFLKFCQDFHIIQQSVWMNLWCRSLVNRFTVANEFSLLTMRVNNVRYASVKVSICSNWPFLHILYFARDESRCGNCYWDEESYWRDRFCSNKN